MGGDEHLFGNKKRKNYGEAVGAMKLSHLPRYDSFIGIKDGIRKLLEMFLGVQVRKA